MAILTEEMATTVYQAQLINVIDGDTVDMHVNLGLGFTFNGRIRLIGIDCPEIYGVPKQSEERAKGEIAKLQTKEWFYNEGPTFWLQAEHKGIHGRWLGEIWKEIGQGSLNDYLITLGYSNNAWKWYSQEPLIENWFDRNPIVSPKGDTIPAWHNWGRPVFIGPSSVMIERFQ